jgi:hypothetical protein
MPDLLAYEFESTDLDDPANSAEVVTPSDVTALTKPSRALYVGVTGNVSVEMHGTGTAIVFTAVPAGSILPIRVTRVNSTGTSATNIVSLY